MGDGLTIQVIDFLDTYLERCRKKNAHVIGTIESSMKEAIDGGEIPNFFNLSGKTRDVKYHRINDEYVEILFAPLSAVSFLESLDLSYNEIGNTGAVIIANFIKEDKFIEYLNLQSNSITGTGGAAIAHALHVNTTIKRLDMSYNSIGNDGGMEFASMLQINTTLTNLSLAGCALSATSLIAFATVLRNNECLEIFDLSNNVSHSNRLTQSLENDIMMHLSTMVKANRGIKILGLAKMGISDWVTVNYLAGAIMGNEGIHELDLSCNKITRDGGVALCQALYKQFFLTTLNLSCCSIQDEGAEAVCVMLLYNRTLKKLYLDHNAIRGKGLRNLAQSLTKNETLTHITLWGNIWDEPACDLFAPLVGGPVKVIAPPSNEAPTMAEKHQSILTKPRSAATASRLKPENVDVVFYVVEGALQVARNEW
ncbi:hypothetical protein HDU76_006307 [Blyttiomyces sp. JEL0837]|nr:hypothetical protein HDU76_006307 [Blyttiomyces sp. JEL0837]